MFPYFCRGIAIRSIPTFLCCDVERCRPVSNRQIDVSTKTNQCLDGVEVSALCGGMYRAETVADPSGVDVTLRLRRQQSFQYVFVAKLCGKIDRRGSIAQLTTKIICSALCAIALSAFNSTCIYDCDTFLEYPVKYMYV